MHIRANAAYMEMFDFESFDDLEGMSLLDLVAPQHVGGFKALLKGLSKGEPPPPRYELKAIDGEGNEFPAVMEFTQAMYEGEPCLRSEEHPSELQSLMRISYAVFCLKKKNKHNRPIE